MPRDSLVCSQEHAELERKCREQAATIVRLNKALDEDRMLTLASEDAKQTRMVELERDNLALEGKVAQHVETINELKRQMMTSPTAGAPADGSKVHLAS